jgi:hypothetical protein
MYTVSFRSPSLFYLLTGVEVVLFSLEHPQTHTTFGRTPLDEGISPSQRPLPDNTNTVQEKKKSMPPVGFEPRIQPSARPQTYALDRAATGIGVTGTHRMNCCIFTAFIVILIAKTHNGDEFF